KDDDWKIINQAVIEVHDIKNRLEIITNILKSKGFFLEYQRAEKFIGINLFIVYATRKKEKINPIYNIPYDLISSQSILFTKLKEFVSNKLPEYMRPTYYKILTEIPKTINGKIDYRQLKIYSTKNQLKTVANISTDQNSEHIIYI